MTAPRPQLLVHAGDEVIVIGRLVVVLTIEMRVRHVVLFVDKDAHCGRGTNTFLVADSSCPDEPEPFTGTCSTCREVGHRADQCFAVRRPKVRVAKTPARWAFLRVEEQQRLAKKRDYMAKRRAAKRAAREVDAA